jgi:hypothetical protein
MKALSSRTRFLGYVVWITAVVLLLARYFGSFFSFLPGCLLKAATGLPCPFCGSTRTVVALGQFDLFNAFVENPLMAVIVLVLPLLFMGSLFFDVKNKEIDLKYFLQEKKAFWILAGILALNWFYLLIRTLSGHF